MENNETNVNTGTEVQAPKKIDWISVLVAPILTIVLALAIIVSSLVSGIGAAVKGGNIVYSDTTFQSHSLSQYLSEFAGDDLNPNAKEDNILIVFLIDEENGASFNCTTILGENLKPGILELFAANKDSAFGKELLENVKEEEKFENLGPKFATIIAAMQKSVLDLDHKTSFNTELEGDKPRAESHVTNKVEKTAIATEELETALTAFTEATEIPIVVYFNTTEAVFGRTFPTGDFIMAALGLAVVAYGIYSMIKNIREAKKSPVTEPEQPAPVSDEFEDDDDFDYDESSDEDEKSSESEDGEEEKKENIFEGDNFN